MARDFGTMKTNVSNDIGDTSASMQSFIGRYLNRRYYKVMRAVKHIWEYLNHDYTISVSAGTNAYALPSDFDKELYVVDTTNELDLVRYSWKDLARNYPGDLTTSGTVERYIIYKRDDGSRYIRLHYTPSSALTLGVPYIVKPTEMSDSTDEPVIDISDLLEIGATADAWRYKRQFAKAQQMEVLFQQNLSEYVWDRENKQNEPTQFAPATFNRDDLV